MLRIKQLICKHNYKPWANIYGNLVNDFNSNKTILLCSKCCKRKYIKEYIEAPLDANFLYEYLALNKRRDPFADEDLKYVIKNKELYEKYFENICDQ